MKRLAYIVAVVSLSLALQGSGGCSSPTSRLDDLREASTLAVAGTNVVEVLE